MKLVKSVIVSLVVMIGLIGTSCKKEQYESRDTSGLKPTPVDPITPGDQFVVFDAADVMDGWEISGGNGQVDNANKKEGIACLKSVIPAADDYKHFIKRRPAPVDPQLTVANGQFVFWFYVSDPALKLDGQIELTSSGQSDKNEYYWNLDQIIPRLKAGWNEIKLNFSDASVSGGDPDIHAFNFFRIYLWTKDKPHASDVEIRVDDLKFRVRPIVSETFSNADMMDGWDISGGNGQVDNANKKEGVACLKSVIPAADDYKHFAYRRPTPLDAGVTAQNGELKFWFYVADPALLKLDGQIELTSSNEPDKHEYSWNLEQIIPGLKPGWNEIKLKFSDAAVSGDGGPNIYAFNFFRIYFWTKDKPHASDVEIRVDDLRVQEHVKVSESFSNADVTDAWEISGGNGQVDNGSKKEGAACLKAIIPAGNDDGYKHFIYRRPTTLNAGVTKANGQLKFWFYVSDVSHLKHDGQIELTSSGQSDKNEYSWNLDQIIPNLKNGWNELKLDFDKAVESTEPTNKVDVTALNFFRIYFWESENLPRSADIEVRVDDLRVQEK